MIAVFFLFLNLCIYIHIFLNFSLNLLLNNLCVNYVMATTAKQSASVRGSSTSPASVANFSEGQEDIETIAKQISDHAEAIYQTWKARGLAPTEILSCHTGNCDAFGKTLTPSLQSSSLHLQQQYTTTIQLPAAPHHNHQHHYNQYQRNKEAPVVELFAQASDMSNNNLEKLVSSFVNEDKARQQAARKNSILTSGTIKDALRKFESVDRTTNVKPNFLRSASPQPNRTSSGASSAAPNTTIIVQQSSVCGTQSNNDSIGNTSNKLNKNVPDVLMNTNDKAIPSVVSTINTIGIKEHSPPRQKPETPVKPASLLNHQPSWPLKNRIGIVSGPRKDASNSVHNHDCNNSNCDEPDNHRISKAKRIADQKKSADLLDEVLMEEERLINALKTGTVLNNDKPLPEVITSALNENLSNTTLPGKNWKKSDILPAMSSSSVSSTVVSNSDSITKQQQWNDVDQHYNKPVTNNIAVNNMLGAQDSNETNSAPATIVKIVKRPRNDAAVPHPEVNVNINKLNINNMNSRSSSVNPAVRPFLTRGSVAERVLMFEKCPEVKALRNTPKEPSKISVSFIFSLSIVIIFYFVDLMFMLQNLTLTAYCH